MTLSQDAQKLWQAAQALALKARTVSPQARVLPPLLFFTDPERTPDPVETANGLPQGAGVVYRHFGAPQALTTARSLRQICTERKLALLIGLDHELAEMVGADGVHLPQRALDRALWLRPRHPGWILTGAAHGPEAFQDVDGLDALIISPVFPAGGRSAETPDLGVARLAELCSLAPRPIYALGGIGPENAALLGDTGAAGIAGVDAIQQAFSAGSI